MAAPGLCGPAPAAIVGAIWITPVSVCHHVSACVLGASMASRGYFSRGRPARRLRSKLAVGHARRAGRARRWVGTRAVPSVGARRGPARRGVQPTGRGARSAGGAARRRRGLRKKKKGQKNKQDAAKRTTGQRSSPTTSRYHRHACGRAGWRWRGRWDGVWRRAREDEQRTKGTPPKGLGVDRLADGAQQLERRARRGRDGVVAGAHERADRRRRRVEVRDLVLVDDAPEAARVGPRRHALEDDLRRAVQQGAVGDVGVARDPAAVGRVQNQTSSARVGASKTVRNEWPAPTM